MDSFVRAVYALRILGGAAKYLQSVMHHIKSSGRLSHYRKLSRAVTIFGAFGMSNTYPSVDALVTPIDIFEQLCKAIAYSSQPFLLAAILIKYVSNRFILNVHDCWRLSEP